MSEPIAAIGGAFAAALAALLGFVGTRRSQRADALARMLVEVREWADDFRESEQQCRIELAQVRQELAGLRRRIAELEDGGLGGHVPL